MATTTIPHYESIRVGGAMGEWQHEYMIRDLVDDLHLCVDRMHDLKARGIPRDILPDIRFDRLYGTREQYRTMMNVYDALKPHLYELWLLVAHTGSLRSAVDAMYTKYLPGQRPDVQWGDVQTYPAMKGMLIAGHPDP